MDDSDHDAGQESVDGTAGLLENAGRVEDDGVDSAKLLEEHERHGNEHRFDQVSAGKYLEVARLDGLRISVVLDYALEFWLNVSMPVGQEQHSTVNHH